MTRAFHQWACQEDYGVSLLSSKQSLLYQLAAGAIAITTKAIKSRISVAKTDFMRKVAGEGHQGVNEILRRVRGAGFGGRANAKPRRPLPVLIDPRTGDHATCREDRDRIWLRFFGEQEKGTVMEVEEYLRTTYAYKQDELFDWTCALLPSRLDIEVMRTTKKGKSPGLDGIPSDLLSIDPAGMARLVQPLYVKSLLRGMQPTQWRGGLLFEAFKNAGAPQCVESYRSLFVSSFVGKSFHKALRGKTAKQTQELLYPLHCGTRPMVPVSYPATFIATHSRRLRKHRRCGGILFVDSKAAYYRIVRDLATGCIESDEQVVELFMKFGLDEEDLADMMSTIQDGGMFRQAGVDGALRHAIKDLHLRTWFTTAYSSGQHLCQSQAGSRPGESFADVVYAYIYSRVLYHIHEVLTADFSLPWDPEDGVFGLGAAGDPQEAWDATWADDSAYAMEGPDARICTVVISTLRSHGMEANLRPRKTSLLLKLCGSGCQKAKQHFFRSGASEVLLPDLGEAIPVMNQYKHLGALLDTNMTMMPEARHRVAIANNAYEQAKQLILHNRDVDLTVRGEVFETAVASSFFNMSLWIPRGRAWDAICHGHARLVRRLLSCHLPGDRVYKAPLALGMWLTKCLPLELHARRQRLGLLMSLANNGPGLIWAALQDEQDWLEVLQADMRWMVEGNESHWPAIQAASWPLWWTALREQKARVKRTIKRRLRDERMRAAEENLVILGLWALSKQVPGEEPPPSRPSDWTCRMCRRSFASRARLSVHVSTYRLYADGTRCQACGTQYWTQGRLGAHLRASHACVRKLQQTQPRVEQVVPGFGSRDEVRHFTIAPPQKQPAGVQTSGEQVWDPLVDEAHEELSDYLLEVAETDSPDGVKEKIDQIIDGKPLYPEEILSLINHTREEIDTVVQAETPAIWPENVLAEIRSALDKEALPRCYGAAAASRDPTLTLKQFRDELVNFTWPSFPTKAKDPGRDELNNYVTPETYGFLLSSEWEAEWRTALAKVSASAVIEDATVLLPTALKRAWEKAIQGQIVQLQAPSSFWAHALAKPFRPLKAQPCTTN